MFPMRYRLLALVGVMLAWNLPMTLADDVYLQNGDQLSGTILGLSKGRLGVTTDYAGDIFIQWKFVTSLSIDNPVTLTLQNGERWIGWLVADDKENSSLLSESGRRRVSLATVVAIHPLTDAERQETASMTRPALWKQRLEAGAQVRSGNTDSAEITVGYQAQRESARSELTANVEAAYGALEGERTAQQARGVGRLDWLHTNRFFTFYLVSLEHDALEALDLRAQELAGVGYKVIRGPRSVVQGDIGFGLREELFESGDSEVEPIGRIGAKWTQKLGLTSELTVSAAFLPDLIERGEYRLEGAAALSTPITNRFLLRLSLLDSYDSNPQPGIEHNDLTLLSSIAWTF